MINVPPESLTKELALKVCSNQKFKRKYVSKYKEYFGGSKTLQQEILRKYNELWRFKSEHYKGTVTINEGSEIRNDNSFFLIGPYIVVLNNPTTIGSECDLQNCIHTYVINQINQQIEKTIQIDNALTVPDFVPVTIKLNTIENSEVLRTKLNAQAAIQSEYFKSIDIKNTGFTKEDDKDIYNELILPVKINSYFSCNIDIDGTSGTGLKVLGFFLIVLTQPWTIGSECDLNTCLKIYTITDETIASVDESGKKVTVTIQNLDNVSKMIVTFTKNGGDKLKDLINEQSESRKKFKKLIETAVKTKAARATDSDSSPSSDELSSSDSDENIINITLTGIDTLDKHGIIFKRSPGGGGPIYLKNEVTIDGKTVPKEYKLSGWTAIESNGEKRVVLSVHNNSNKVITTNNDDISDTTNAFNYFLSIENNNLTLTFKRS